MKRTLIPAVICAALLIASAWAVASAALDARSANGPWKVEITLYDQAGNSSSVRLPLK